MRIQVVAFAYNEIKYIADFVRYYRAHGCDVFVLDNDSTDGTHEWLKRNGVRTRVLKTGGAFHLKKLQEGLTKELAEIRPDWVVYTGIDVYFSFDKSIRATIEDAAAEGYNMISVKYFNMYNTGETSNAPMSAHYFYGRDLGSLHMISKYQHPFSFEADSIQIKNRKIVKVPGVVINYGNCKPAEERMATYERRRKAWKEGLDKNYGVHYIEGVKRGWRWEKEELIDLRKTEYFKYIRQI